MCGLRELRLFNVSGNSLSGAQPLQGCREMLHLAAIDLSANLFEGVLPLDETLLPQLKFLNLSRNGFDERIPDTWGRLMPSLEVL